MSVIEYLTTSVLKDKLPTSNVLAIVSTTKS